MLNTIEYEDNKMSKLIKNKSQGFGYKYSSLADFHKAGITIPKMRIKAMEFGEYIEYFDGTEWQQGAKVVEMEMKGMNPAQAYGSALTYARRYTVAMAEAIATDDDAVEKDKEAKPRAANTSSTTPSVKQIAFAKQLAYNQGCNSPTEYDELFKEKTGVVPKDAKSSDYSKFIEAIKE